MIAPEMHQALAQGLRRRDRRAGAGGHFGAIGHLVIQACLAQRVGVAAGLGAQINRKGFVARSEPIERRDRRRRPQLGLEPTPDIAGDLFEIARPRAEAEARGGDECVG